MEKNIIEEWRNVIGFEGLYQISNLGRIKSLGNDKTKKEKILKPQINSSGYYHVRLSKNHKCECLRIHRLVALAFIPNPDNLPFINHKDENKTNNCVDNLEWCDCKYNTNYGTAIERRTKKIAEKLKNRKDLSQSILQLDLEGKLINEYQSINEAERQTGFAKSNISNCLKCKRKTCGGFIWKYKE